MKQKIRIGILGIGAVGGYIGGLLAEKYQASNEIEVIFITKPAQEKVLKENGLKLITLEREVIAFPYLVTSNIAVVGLLDVLIVAVKSYDLEESLRALRDCLSEETMILPLLNGIDAKERIEKLFPHSEVVTGCVYIVSRLLAPDVVNVSSKVHSLYFGSHKVDTERLAWLYSILVEAGIEAHLSEDIEKVIWEKFIFISSIASLTSYLNMSIGEILASSADSVLLMKLLEEVTAVARAKGVNVAGDIIEQSVDRMEKLPFETTSSMHSDFQKGRKTEYQSLTEYVCLAGQAMNIATPTFNLILRKLRGF